MNRTLRATWMVTAVAAAAVLVGGWLMTSQPAMAQNAGNGEKLHHLMEDMGRLFKQVRGSIKDVSKYPAAADATAKLEALTVEAKAMMPDKVAKMPADKREAAMKEYRVDMCKLLKDLSDLEAALVQGDQTKANEALAACGGAMKSGHEEFREKD